MLKRFPKEGGCIHPAQEADTPSSFIGTRNEMGCGQTKEQSLQTPQTTPRPKSVTFRNPPVEFVDVPFDRPNTAVKVKRRPQCADDIYPPMPPRTKRKEIIADDKIFHAVDQRALETPKSVALTVEGLHKYLVKGISDDMMKCRAFYRWIANNISYDTMSMFQGKRKPVDAESVLVLRTSICAGYCNLFAALCRLSGIPVEIISGYSKGYDYDPEVLYVYGHATNHSWIAVHVNGDWRLVEVTWAAGHIDEYRRYHFDYHDGYFFMDPEFVIYTHYPVIRHDVQLALCWQLLEHTWSLEEFNKALKPTAQALDWGIQFPSHKSVLVFVNAVCNIRIECPETFLNVVSADLTPEKGERSKNYCYVYQSDEQEYTVTVRPPNIGKYSLRILGSALANDTEAECLTTYLVKCVLTDGVVRPYPYHWGAWGPVHDFAKFGLSSSIRDQIPLISSDSGEITTTVAIDKPVEASARLLHAESLVKDCDDYVMLERSEHALHITARLPREGFYKLEVLVKIDDTNYVAAINSLLECKMTPTNCRKLPKCYKAARDFNCRLLEPLVYELPSNISVTIKLKAGNLTNLVLKKQQVKHTPLEGIWTFTCTTPSVGEKFILAGNNLNQPGLYKGLYEFVIV